MIGSSAKRLTLRLCPQCDGQTVDVGVCSVCDNTGVLDQDLKPFAAPAPFDTWTAKQLVELDQASRERSLQLRRARLSRHLEEWTLTRSDTDEPAAVHAPRRLTLSEIIELQLAALQRSGAEHSSVKLTRNARGDTQIEVSVRTGEGSVETVEQARLKAQEQYDHLRDLYPMSPVSS